MLRTASYAPAQARGMTKPISLPIAMHRNAALRARRAGFNIIYVYAGHGLSLGNAFFTASAQSANG